MVYGRKQNTAQDSGTVNGTIPPETNIKNNLLRLTERHTTLMSTVICAPEFTHFMTIGLRL